MCPSSHKYEIFFFFQAGVGMGNPPRCSNLSAPTSQHPPKQVRETPRWLILPPLICIIYILPRSPPSTIDLPLISPGCQPKSRLCPSSTSGRMLLRLFRTFCNSTHIITLVLISTLVLTREPPPPPPLPLF
jgi:hypothetical protein